MPSHHKCCTEDLRHGVRPSHRARCSIASQRYPRRDRRAKPDRDASPRCAGASRNEGTTGSHGESSQHNPSLETYFYCPDRRGDRHARHTSPPQLRGTVRAAVRGGRGTILPRMVLHHVHRIVGRQFLPQGRRHMYIRMAALGGVEVSTAPGCTRRRRWPRLLHTSGSGYGTPGYDMHQYSSAVLASVGLVHRSGGNRGNGLHRGAAEAYGPPGTDHPADDASPSCR